MYRKYCILCICIVFCKYLYCICIVSDLYFYCIFPVSNYNVLVLYSASIQAARNLILLLCICIVLVFIVLYWCILFSKVYPSGPKTHPSALYLYCICIIQVFIVLYWCIVFGKLLHTSSFSATRESHACPLASSLTTTRSVNLLPGHYPLTLLLAPDLAPDLASSFNPDCLHTG